MSLAQHLPILPIVLPLFTGAALLLVNERRVEFKAAISLGAALALIACATALVAAVAGAGPLVYRVGDWPSAFGIVLVADRLSAALVLLAGVLGLAAGWFSMARWHGAGPRFHALLQFLLMGVNGAFLTGDLFNLFVFFEVLLVASYGLALHGAGTARVRASLHYIAANLLASLLFLVGASLIYGTTGTLNMAELSVRIPAVASADRGLLDAGAALLAVAFLVKAGMWPLSFWLPGTYAAVSPPAAAMFALLTKVGVYSVLRTWLLFFVDDGTVEPYGADVLMAGGLVTLAFGAIGVMASQNLRRVTAYSLVVSAGTLLAAVAVRDVAVTSAALYYLAASTLGVSAMFLLVELLERGRAPGADILAVTAEAYIEPEEELPQEAEVGFAIPGSLALLGSAFVLCAVVLAGLPPLAGFVGKFGLLHALFDLDRLSGAAWSLFALLIVSGFAAIVALARAGVRRFWVGDAQVVSVRVVEIAPVFLLIGLCVAMTVGAGSVMEYLRAAAESLHAPAEYVRGVVHTR
ncbi:MAG TPA: monovalent cation/H+ antiporter subunit D [Burkholderiales bacterium]|nr:monovalent cation/H+ antiporter subunit D [Burkholderiales bacterium]